MAEISDIYQFIVELGTRSKLPGLWARNKCDAAFFDLLYKPADLLKRLRKKFTVEDLRRAGVVTVGGKKPVRLSPQLAENPSVHLAHFGAPPARSRMISSPARAACGTGR